MIVKNTQALKRAKSSVKRGAPVSPNATTITKMTSRLERAAIWKDRLKAQEAKLKKANADLAREIGAHKHSEELFRRAVDLAPTGLLMIDLKGTILLANLRMENMFKTPASVRSS